MGFAGRNRFQDGSAGRAWIAHRHYHGKCSSILHARQGLLSSLFSLCPSHSFRQMCSSFSCFFSSLQFFTLTAKSFLPPCIGRTCTCTESFNDDGWDGASAKLEIQWAVLGEEEGSLFARQVGVETSSVLVVAEQTARMLKVGHTYTVQVEVGAWTGFSSNNIERFATVATVQLKVQPLPPVVRIKFGNRHLQWGTKSEQKRLVLDGSESWDPDSVPGDPRLKYFWFLDCETMFMRLSQTFKDRYGINRKAYLQACASTTLGLKLMSLANRAVTYLMPDGTSFVQVGVNVFDTFVLSENSEGIPMNDLVTLHPAGAKFDFPLEIVIGLRLTDVDESTHNDTISIFLTDKVSHLHLPYLLRFRVMRL
jgi:hypothetical protein